MWPMVLVEIRFQIGSQTATLGNSVLSVGICAQAEGASAGELRNGSRYKGQRVRLVSLL